MDIIISHNSLDFDGLASMVAAGKLYPSAVKVFSGTLSKNVKQFMALYKDSLRVRMPGEINIEEVKRVILVDTKNLNRLGNLKGLSQIECEYIVFDHHPTSPDDITGSVHEVHPVGAATTILLEKIKGKGINLSPFEATILALGIYEDTGSLLFSSTTARDAMAVAYLLEQGANLSVVSSFVSSSFSGEQRQLLQRLMATVKHYEINGMDVVLATSEEEGFTPGLDLVVHRLSEVEACEAIFVASVMQGKINVVARSRTSNILVNEVLASLGGRGHEKAASAIVKGKSLDRVVKDLLKALQEKTRPGLLARDIMSTPVKSIPEEVSMEEAGKTMLRYGHTGMPVVDGDRMVGVISRRDVDKARIHKLGHAPVKGFMSRMVVSVAPDTPVTDIQKIMVERDIGRVPVIEEDRLVGIVSRTDVLRILHGDEYPEDHVVLYNGPEEELVSNCQELMEVRLPRRIREILEMAGSTADMMGYNVYCVGGFVRDLFLQVPNFDVDLVVEGEGTRYALQFAGLLGGRARIHERFKTAVVILPDGVKIDVATARTEYYEFPAALPRVERSSIREDLYRRDFTINTIAICLNRESFGKLVDYFGGQRDIQDGWIRILYNLSFVEDPTRILRAIRFEQRFKFKIEPDTLRLARDAIERRLLGQLSFKRIQQELILILSEKDPVPALNRMHEIGVWQYVLPEVELDQEMSLTLRRVPRVLGWLAERHPGLTLRSWVVYTEVLCGKLREEALLQVLERYHFDRETNRSLLKSLDIPQMAAEFDAVEEPLMSELDSLIGDLAIENIVYFMLCLKNEATFEMVNHYLEIRNNSQIEINGNDLKKMGIKQGPVYHKILQKVKMARLDDLVKSRQDELDLVRQLLEEGTFEE